MKFLVDENLPPRLAAWLNTLGHDALHARDLGATGAPDATLLAAARKSERVIITQDRDFDDAASARVMRLCFGNAPTPVLLALLEPHLDAALACLEAGERLVLVPTD
jgi:predicted nuclease of predicted toxin-antitoxin system